MERKQPKEAELAWFAGLFDGEGCISLVHRSRPANRQTRSLHIRIGMTNFQTLEKVKEIWGLGTIYLYPRKVSKDGCVRKPLWAWQTSANIALYILEKTLPYFVTKKAEAEVAIAFQKTKQIRKVFWAIPKQVPNKVLAEEERLHQMLVIARSKN